MPRTRTKFAIALVGLVMAALLAYVAAGPYLTIRAIRQAVIAQDAATLADQVDFPALRASLKAQLYDALVREAGPALQSNVLGAVALTMAAGVVNGAVEGMVNPIGLSAVMQGRRLWRNTRESVQRPALDANGDPIPPAPQTVPLHDAQMHYESLSKFTATIRDDNGQPIVFVLRRKGLHWRLADIRLPLGKTQSPATVTTPN